MIWQWTPFIFIIVIAGLQALPSEVLDASKVDGANWWQQIFLVKLPMISSILVIALLMRLIDVFPPSRSSLSLFRLAAALE